MLGCVHEPVYAPSKSQDISGPLHDVLVVTLYYMPDSLQINGVESAWCVLEPRALPV